MKLQVSLDDDLVNRIDSYADSHYMSRSGLITLSMQQFLLAEETKNVLRSMDSTLNRIADMGKIDEESKRQLEELARFCKFIATGTAK